MTAAFQLVIDCAEPERLARFWAAALGYVPEPPPAGRGPRIWFQVVPEAKTIKNRLHIDVQASGGRQIPLEIRREQVDAAARRLARLGATMIAVSQEGADHYAVAMRDPEGNEFDIN